jgi:aspartyl-tRNA(Asn)/glutamyl-tRNA(Gln) amidotransferase subunit B
MVYETIIGFEVHVELSTRTKVFCGCSTRFGQPANTQVCPVCLGLPGSLPVLNEKAVDYSIRAALALNCQVSPVTTFERKNYYYPDLPKNYQISQLRQNLGENGHMDIPVEGGHKRIRINNIHLEEDAGKSVHPEHFAGEEYSLVDLNRAGTPLLEIVSEPDIRSVEEAEAYMRSLKNILEYIDISDCNMHEGRLRFEVNISHRKEGETELPNYRSEIKNIGSIKSALRAIRYERTRQCRALDKGETLRKDTRLWDEASGRTEAMRGKEGASDYRYFPEPDLVDVEIDAAWLARVAATLPELPAAKKQRFVAQYQLPEYDAEILTASIALAQYYEGAVVSHNNPKAISNWVMTDLLRELNERDLEPDESPISPERLAGLVKMIDEGAISGKIAKTVFADMLESGKDAQTVVREKGLVQVKDDGQIEAWVDQAIAENPGPVDDLRNGKERALGFLVGQIMKMSRGKANPGMVNELLKKKIL